ncbi:F-box/kelch-repeat protein [Iris pallida]|uniref:F-box/kelch-repeat protein n=1 Tax=Iris pallida TaxID=29817 RepID=A0AAX6GV00_IRIPA|nr:F-box/kelch-repeat protein [Iris pallida]
MEMVEADRELPPPPLYGDVLESVLSHVPTLDLLPARRVSRTWRASVVSSLRHSPRQKPWLLLRLPRFSVAYDPHSRSWVPLKHVLDTTQKFPNQEVEKEAAAVSPPYRRVVSHLYSQPVRSSHPQLHFILSSPSHLSIHRPLVSAAWTDLPPRASGAWTPSWPPSARPSSSPAARGTSRTPRAPRSSPSTSSAPATGGGSRATPSRRASAARPRSSPSRPRAAPCTCSPRAPGSSPPSTRRPAGGPPARPPARPGDRALGRRVLRGAAGLRRARRGRHELEAVGGRRRERAGALRRGGRLDAGGNGGEAGREGFGRMTTIGFSTAGDYAYLYNPANFEEGFFYGFVERRWESIGRPKELDDDRTARIVFGCAAPTLDQLSNYYFSQSCSDSCNCSKV